MQRLKAPDGDLRGCPQMDYKMIVTPALTGVQFESAWIPARFLQGLSDRDDILKLIRQLTDGIET